VLDKLGRENMVANFFSRINNPSRTFPVIDRFPTENLFAGFVKNPWFAGIASYFSTGKFPPYFSKK